MKPNRREFFRLQYDRDSPPSFLCLGRTLSVLDLSEGGIKLSVGIGPITSNFKVGGKLAGFITFPTGERIFISGVVIWLSPDSLSLQLSTQVPYRLILSEQRRLIAHLKQKA